MDTMAASTPLVPGLGMLDWLVLGLYLLGTVALGASFYKGQKTTKDFFLAGRSMSWFPVGLSVVATLFSAISYIGLPSATQKYGLVLLAGSFAVFLCIPIVTRVFMPFYHHMQVYSAYEYLEKRFDIRVRCLASGLFILWRIVWMSTAVYAPSLALWAATGGAIPLIPTIITLGVFATAYTMLGGMKAVIWTDVIQFFALFGGMVLAIIFIVIKVPGGVGGIWDMVSAAGKTSFVIDVPGLEAAQTVGEKFRAYFFLTSDRCTLLAVLVASFIGHIGFYTVDQVTVQRYFTTKSLKDAKKSFWLNSFANVSLHFGLAFVGLGLLAYFKLNPCPEMIQGQTFRPDWGYPYFAATALPAGVAGLILAALYAATMSSVDSGINSCTTAFMVDFWRRLKYGDVSINVAADSEEKSRDDLRMARILTVVLGVLVTCIACFVGKLGSIIVIAGKLVNGFCGPMFVIFLMGMFSKRAKPLGVAIGAILAMGIMWHYSFFATTKLNFKWTSTMGFVVAFLSCYGLSVFQDALRYFAGKDRRLYDVYALAAVGLVMATVVGVFGFGFLSLIGALGGGAVVVLLFAESASMQDDAEKLSWTFLTQRRKWRGEG